MWWLVFFIVVFPSPSFSVKGSSSQTETALPPVPEHVEAPQKPPKEIQLGISTDDDYFHNPKITRTPVKVENFSNALAQFIKPGDSTVDDVKLDKTKRFSTSLSPKSQTGTDNDDEPEAEKLERFSRSLSRSSSKFSSTGSSPKSSGLSRFGSFSQSLYGSFKLTDDDKGVQLQPESDDEESFPSRSLSKSSTISTDSDKSVILNENMYVVPDVISTPRSFIKKPKALSAEDKDVYAAAINQNFWLRLGVQVYTASVTPYRMLRLPREEIRPIRIKGFKMIRMVTILRHSIRLPTEETVVEMKERLPELRLMLKEAADKYGTPFSQAMDNWTMYDELAQHGVEMKTLVREGKREASKLGRRFRKFFKHLLPKKFDKESIIVKFTDCPRTKDTAFSFIEGMNGKLPEGDDWYEQVDPKKSVLKYDSTCVVWKSFKKSDFNRYLSKSFMNGPYLKETAKDVATRFGLGDEFTVDDLLLVYETCSFEVAWTKSSAWCELLTEEHMKVLEYAADLELYIIAGYANVMNTRIPCRLYNDLMDNLLNNKNLKALFYVTHLTSILKFLAFLGLYQDINIRLIKHRPVYNPDVEERYWRTAYIGSFTTNITFVLFEDKKEKLWIQVRHQERAVYIPMCPTNAELLCPLETFEMIFERFSYGNCRFDEWCKEEKIYPKEKNKYFNREYNVGKRKEKLLKKYKEAEDAKKDTAGKEKDYRRIKSTGSVEPEKALDKEPPKAKKGDEELSESSQVSKIEETEEEDQEHPDEVKKKRSSRFWAEYVDDSEK